MGSVLTTPEGIFAQPLQRQKPVALRMIGCVATPGNPVCGLSHASGPGQKQCRATRTPEAPVCDVTLIRDQARCRRVFRVTRVTGRTCPVVIEKVAEDLFVPQHGLLRNCTMPDCYALLRHKHTHLC